MSRKLVIGVAVLLAAAAALLLIQRQDRGESPDSTKSSPPMVERKEHPSPGPSSAPARAEALARWDLPKARVSPHAEESDEHQAWISEKVADLQDLAWFFDEPEVLKKVMADLRSPEPALRHAAREGVINLGSRDAIPYLESAAALTDDAQEKKALIDAAEFLKLPTILEVRDSQEK